MDCVKIYEELYDTYSEIRLGCLKFKADVKPSDDSFWIYMNEELLPDVSKNIEGKEWSEIPGVKAVVRHTRLSEEIPDAIAYLTRHC